MKKIVAYFLITILFAYPLSYFINSKKLNVSDEIVLNNVNSNLTSDDYDVLENWGEVNNGQNVIVDFKNAIEIKDSSLVINAKKLENKVFDEVIEIYERISIALEDLLLVGLKNDDIDEIRNFISNIEQENIYVSTYKIGLSFQFKWYWFGWGKIKFDNQLSINLSRILATASTVGEFASIISGWFPEVGIVIAAFTLFCVVHDFIFTQWNKGNGVWIGTLGFAIYDVGWGSL